MRSTPCPKLILRTVKLACGPEVREITTPSKACTRSLSPSLILTCTRTVSPGPNLGKSVRRLLASSFSMMRLDISFPLCVGQVGPGNHSKFFFPKFGQVTARPPGSVRSAAADRDGCAASSPRPRAGASGESAHDRRKPALPAPPCRETLPAAYSADNPAALRKRTWRRAWAADLPSGEPAAAVLPRKTTPGAPKPHCPAPRAAAG